MLDFFCKLSGQENRGAATFDLDETISLVIKSAKKRQSVLIILCGEIIENYDVFLNQLAMNLYNLGLIDDSHIERRELLSILSGYETIESIVREIKDICNRYKRILYIRSFHQYEYSNANTAQLLNRLQELQYNNQIDAPIVLNVPVVVKKELMDIHSELWKDSICYTNRKSQPYSYQQNRTSVYGDTSEYSRNEVNTRVTENSNTSMKAVSGGVYDGKRENLENRPWYIKDLELLKQEKDGMVMLLKDSNAQFEIAALPRTKRLNWYFRLTMVANGVNYNLSLRIIYLESFSRDNPVVGLVVEDASERLYQAISRNSRCEDIITTDPEFKKVYIITPIKHRNNGSVAAATLDGFIDLLRSLKRYEVI